MEGSQVVSLLQLTTLNFKKVTVLDKVPSDQEGEYCETSDQNPLEKSLYFN